jgi:hypothetical protein
MFIFVEKKEMKIYEFTQKFPDETSCRMHFKAFREREGIICKKCSNTKHYWLQSKWQWQCSECRFEQLSVVERFWSQLSCHSTSGICAWPL